eukprot:4371417-Pyramimonas_sp.AAC.1
MAMVAVVEQHALFEGVDAPHLTAPLTRLLEAASVPRDDSAHLMAGMATNGNESEADSHRQ